MLIPCSHFHNYIVINVLEMVEKSFLNIHVQGNEIEEVFHMKTVFVAGANGRTGHKIAKLLVQNGYEVIGLVRQDEHKKLLEDVGASGVLGDLTESFSEGLRRVDAVICAAGAGIDHDPEEVDHVGTVRLIEQCVLEGIDRFIMISSMGTNNPDSMPHIKPYLIAKRQAEMVLEESTLTHTIIRPGGLTDDEPTGFVEAAPRLEQSGHISRGDVAQAAVLALSIPHTENQSFDLVRGNTPIEQALASLIVKHNDAP